ncbi:uncharacterized protein V3H82_008434 [Fundulus diaphanus]
MSLLRSRSSVPSRAEDQGAFFEGSRLVVCPPGFGPRRHLLGSSAFLQPPRRRKRRRAVGLAETLVPVARGHAASSCPEDQHPPPSASVNPTAPPSVSSDNDRRMLKEKIRTFAPLIKRLREALFSHYSEELEKKLKEVEGHYRSALQAFYSRPEFVPEGLADASAPESVPEGLADASAPESVPEGLADASAPESVPEGLADASAPVKPNEVVQEDLPPPKSQKGVQEDLLLLTSDVGTQGGPSPMCDVGTQRGPSPTSDVGTQRGPSLTCEAGTQRDPSLFGHPGPQKRIQQPWSPGDFEPLGVAYKPRPLIALMDSQLWERLYWMSLSETPQKLVLRLFVAKGVGVRGS